MQRARHTASLVTALAETQRDSAPAQARRHAHADMRARRHARTRSGGRTRLPAWSLVHELQAPTNATHENARHEMLDMGDYARHASEGEGNSGSTHGKTHIMLLLAIDASAGVALGRRDWPAGEDGSGGDRHVARNQR